MNLFSGGRKARKRGISIDFNDIGEIESFRQTEHVQIDPNSPVGLIGLPPQLAAVLQVAGVNEQQLSSQGGAMSPIPADTTAKKEALPCCVIS